MMTATYSPEDNKLRLYASGRLDAETYARVKGAGFKWAPKQGLFVAPMWTPEREDLLIELCGEVGDEDTSLVERQEERAGRFGEYSEHRKADAEAAHSAVSAICDNIPLGQPILVGHHSERYARRDAEKIENGMRKAVKMWETSEYWRRRAAGAIAHAKYKELPDVRARRIKGIEADKRRIEKSRAEAVRILEFWSAPNLDLETAKIACGHSRAGYLRLPRKEGDRPDWDQSPSAYDVLGESRFPSLYAPRTLEEVVAVAVSTYPRFIAGYDRWISHYENRLAYERAMLGESGGLETDKTRPEVGGAVQCWASPGRFDANRGWSFIQKVNKVSVTLHDVANYGVDGKPPRVFRRIMPFDKCLAVMSRADVEAAKAAGTLREVEKGTGFFIEAAAPKPAEPEPAPAEPDRGEEFRAMKETLREGVKVVSAPQLFPTPPHLAERLVKLADLWCQGGGQRILEPSAGTGKLLEAFAGKGREIVAVEINPALADGLRQRWPGIVTHTADFLECNGDLGKFDRVLMNPPFKNGEDIRHIRHAAGFLKPGGRLVALCADGPRQREALRPLAEASGGTYEPIGGDLFEGTGVNVAIVTIEA